MTRSATRFTLRTRLALSVAVVVAVVIVFFTSIIYLLVGHEMRAEQDLSLQREATRVTRLVEAQADWTASGYCEIVGSPACSRVIDNTEPVDTGGSDLPVTDAALDVAAGARKSFYADTVVNGAGVRMLVTPVSADRALLIGTPTAPVDKAIGRLGLVIVGFTVFGVLLAGMSGYVSARIGLRPVQRLTEVAERVATTRDARLRIDVTGSDELARLASSMNTMLGALEAAQDAQRQLVADASHELRTPLTSLQTNLALLAREELDANARAEIQASVRREMVGMTALVNDLIELAHGDENTASDDVEMVELLRFSLDRATKFWPNVRYQLEVKNDAATPWIVPGDASRLARMINNLLDNAGKFSPPGGTVTVSLSADEESLELSVQDQGPGFNDSELELVFERFYRSTTARALPGSGLGLAIVRQTAQAHGGNVSITNIAPGARVTVHLPLA
ncbi:sensor histidine kinase [Arthrobacter sp. TMN-49]